MQDLAATGRCPHALLVHGRSGSGRRQLALWLAATALGADPTRRTSDGEAEAGHPDFAAIEPEEGKQSIGVEQVRELIRFLELTSHGNRGRVAIIWPADAMTLQAANSLLKTLEEPPGGTIIVLIAETLARLPATIVSRCQRIRIPPPSTEVALDWLGEQAPGADLGPLLQFCGGAPLATLELHEANFAADAGQFAADMRELEEKRVDPVAVAARWKSQPDLALDWLYWRLSRRVREGLGVAADDTPADTLDAGPEVIQACFRQMSQIRELRRIINGGINAELSIAGLLMDWYGGFGRA